MYLQGQGVPQDYAKAVHWFRKAADQRLAPAQFFLGIVYGLGRRVPKDDVLAYMWLNLAASSGHKNTAESRDSLATLMTPEQVAEAQGMARRWFTEHGKSQ